MDLAEMGYWDRSWMELAQDRIDWLALILTVVNTWFHLAH
jgi:hypothetical protein